MPLDLARMINIPGSAESAFDHGAYEPRTRRVFVAHTGKNRVEVLASETTSHTATLDGFPHAAGVVADDGHVLVTNRGSASLAWLDAESLKPRAVIQTGPLPNGVALVAQSKLAIVACIGDESAGPTLHCLSLGTSNRWSIELPGRPRWCPSFLVSATFSDGCFLAPEPMGSTSITVPASFMSPAMLGHC
jgi:hypothetical protein